MKSPLKSRTLWFNLVILAAGVAGFVAGHDVIQEWPQIAAALVALQGGLNIVLRFMTSEPIQ